MAVKLIYGDIALGAAENANVSVSDAATFSAPASLPFGVNTGAVATLEINGWGLSHDYKLKDKQPFALWSESISNDEGVFTTPPRIELDFSEQYTATGLTFRFSPAANEYCSEIQIEWYQNGAIKDSGTYYPNAGEYAVENTVEAFDKVVITLLKTNLPKRRAKLEQIIIGIIREFTGEELTDASFIHEINLVSAELPYNVMDASFHSRETVDFIFQKKQPVEAYDEDKLIGTYYIEDGEQTGARDYTISCQDALGVLDLDTYSGGIWLEDTPFPEIVSDIVNGIFGVDISAGLTNAKLRGYIPECTRREALQLALFAAGAVADTAGTGKIKMFPSPTGTGAEIPAAETYIGGTVSTSDVVSAVHLTGYSIDLMPDVDISEDIDYETIKFDGVEYICARRVYIAENPNTTAGMLANVVTYDGCYLINADNGQERADSLLAYHMRRRVYNTSHVLHGQTTGDRATVHLPWGGTENANIIKMQITISGINASNSDFLLD